MLEAASLKASETNDSAGVLSFRCCVFISLEEDIAMCVSRNLKQGKNHVLSFLYLIFEREFVQTVNHFTSKILRAVRKSRR